MKATLSLRRAAALDWGKVKAVLAPQDFAVVSAQRARHQELSRVLATPLPKVDLEQYKQVLANQEVVAQVEQALAGYKPVTGDVSPVLRSLDEQQAKAVCRVCARVCVCMHMRRYVIHTFPLLNRWSRPRRRWPR